MVLRFSHVYIRHSLKIQIFNEWLLLFVFSIILLLISKRWWILFLGWEGLGLTRFWLVAFYTSWIAHNGRILTFLTNRLGDSCLLATRFYWISDFMSQQTLNFNFFFWFLLIIGLWTKRAQFPFMRWLPAAIRAPTPISALVHSSTLVTAGLYLLIKFNWVKIIRISLRWWLGTITLIIGSWVALSDLDFKKVVAFSTLSQLGLILFLFASKRLCVVIYHLLAHAFFKRRLFICVGIIILICYSTQSAHIYSSSRLNRLRHFSWFILTLINLASMPFITGFYSKEYRINQTLTHLPIFTTCTIFFLFSLTFLYSWRILINLSLKRRRNLRTQTIHVRNFQGSAINLLFLLILGYVWALNFWITSFDSLFYTHGLFILWLFSFFTLTFLYSLIFYLITHFLKTTLTFKWLATLNQNLHLVLLPRWITIFFNWKNWTFFLLLFFINFW